jgi:hypothetical protein
MDRSRDRSSGLRLAVDAGVGRPEYDLAGLRVDQPPVLVAGLFGHGVDDFRQNVPTGE